MMDRVKTSVLLFAIVGLFSGIAGGISMWLLPDTLFMSEYYPAIILGVFLYIAGAYIADTSSSRNLLGLFILTASCICGWYLAIVSNYVIGGSTIALIISFGLLLVWKIRSNILMFIIVVTVSGALGHLAIAVTQELINQSDKWFVMVFWGEFESILLAGTALAYHASRSDAIRPEWINRTFLILGIPAAIGVFLPFISVFPFTYNVSPFDAVFGYMRYDFMLLGIPFFLSICILIWKLRLEMSRSVTSAEMVTGYMFAMGGLFATAIFLVARISEDNSFSFKEWAIWVTCSLLIVFCIYFAYHNFRKSVSNSSKVHLALLSAYIPNAVLCLWIFFGGWEIGAIVSAFTVIVYLTEIVIITMNEWNGKQPLTAVYEHKC